ncbi:MAG TPA: O-antigen ligase family protein [Thermoguttaceae bacterium]|nr:O-antigen ligase family protein [Thermoguttaceae bacterium]
MASPDRLRPWLLGAMTALFVARPLFPSEAAADGDGLTVVMLWIALAVLWLLGAVGRPEFRVRLGWTDAGVLLLIGLHTLAGIWAAGHVSPRPAVNMIWEYIGLGLAYFMARQLIVGRREARAVVAVMIAVAVGLSVYGLYQYGVEMPRTQRMFEEDPDAVLREAGDWSPPGSPERDRFKDRLFSNQPMATFAMTNSLAGYLGPWVVVLVGLGVGSGLSRKRLGSWARVGFAAVPVAVCLVLTGSRSAWIATLLGLVLVWWFCRQRKERLDWKLPAGAAALGAIVICVAAATGMLSGATKSLGYRLEYWQSTLGMIADHPFAGCGPGNFQYAYSAYKLPEASEEVADPHNFLMELWATAGTGTMLTLVAVLGCYFWTSWRRDSLALWERAGVRGSSVRAGEGKKEEDNDAPQSPHPSPLPEGEGVSVSLRFVLGGAVCGWLLSWPLGSISSAPPSEVALWIVLPLAAGCVALLRGWIVRGELPGALPAIGVVVLLVHLSAAGGIGFPGVAGSLWLLLALGLTGDRPKTLPRGTAWSGLVVALALAATCYSSAYGAVLDCQTALRLARQKAAEGRGLFSKDVERLYLEAAAADPLSAEPLRRLAALTFNAWTIDRSEATFRRFEDFNAQTLRRVPNSSSAWLASGDWYRRAFLTAGRQEDIEKAVDAYAQAVARYPNSALCHARLAVALHEAGRHEEARQEADEALRLDRMMPHEDKKLERRLSPADQRLLLGVARP